jgi:putative PIN family toxin of toxin-antitoxin system
MKPKIVLDTCVFVAGLLSKKGASHRLLRLIGQGGFNVGLSVPLVFEYESAGKKIARSAGLKHSDIDDVIDYLCSVAEHHKIHFLWRPFLRDPSDDMVLELAVEGGAGYIVTFNLKDFAGIEDFGVSAVTPQEFLRMIGERQ